MMSTKPELKGFGDDAEKAKENNRTNQFYWMKNSHGRKVPVGRAYLKEALSKGYIHIDGELQSDDLDLDVRKHRVRKVKVEAQLAEAIKALASAQTKAKDLGVKVDAKKAETKLEKKATTKK